MHWTLRPKRARHPARWLGAPHRHRCAQSRLAARACEAPRGCSSPARGSLEAWRRGRCGGEGARAEAETVGVKRGVGSGGGAREGVCASRARCTFISRWARGARSAGSSDAGRGKELLPPPSVLSAAAVPPPLLSAPSPPADGLESGSGEDDGPCETGGCPSGRGDVHGVANRSPWPATAATTTTTATAAAAHLAWGRPRLPAD